MTGYFTRSQSFSVRYADPKYKKDKVKYFLKLIKLGEAKAFVKEKSKDLNEQFKAAVSKVIEAHFTIRANASCDEYGPNTYIDINCVLAVEEELTDEERNTLEEIGEKFLKKMAKEFNKQPFTETEYGYAKMPGNMKYGFNFVYGANPEDIVNGTV